MGRPVRHWMDSQHHQWSCAEWQLGVSFGSRSAELLDKDLAVGDGEQLQ